MQPSHEAGDDDVISRDAGSAQGVVDCEGKVDNRLPAAGVLSGGNITV